MLQCICKDLRGMPSPKVYAAKIECLLFHSLHDSHACTLSLKELSNYIYSLTCVIVFLLCRLLQERCHITAICFSTWRVCYKNYRPSNEFEEFLEIYYYERLSTHSNMCRHLGPQTKSMSSPMWKQSLSRDEMTFSWPFKLCRLNRIIKVCNLTGVTVLITDYVSANKWQRSKFLWRWRPNQVDYLLQKCFSQLVYSLMMAMIIILKCGDVEVNPGPQTSKLKLLSRFECHLSLAYYACRNYLIFSFYNICTW
jgi:hypothetical protein